MPLVDRASNVLALLLSEDRLRKGDIYFVTHSFGGLIFEQLLRTANDRSLTDGNAAELVRRISRVVFLGTPHRGADIALWARRLGLLFRPSSATDGLGRNTPNLRGLNLWYRGYAAESGIATLTLIETRSSQFGWVVKPDSADPGLPSEPIPVDADHFELASPKSTDSEVYRLIVDFLRLPDTVFNQRSVVTSVTLNAMAADMGRSSAALERITEQLATTAISGGLQQKIPSVLVDAETEKRLTRLRKVRFFFGSDHVEQASRLASDLIHGDLTAASTGVKASTLAWCVRLTLAHPISPEALELLNVARNLLRTEEVSIAEAFADFYQGDPSSALGKLAGLGTKAAKTAALFVIAHTKTAIECLEWIQNTRITLSDVDPDGKFIIMRKQLEAGRWRDALESATSLQPSDFEQTPVLLYVAGGAHLVQAVPDELKTLILLHLPFDAAPIPLADDLASLTQRRLAKDLYLQASNAAGSLGCARASGEASDRALWLALRDPDTRLEARAELVESMRNPANSLRRLALALQFGLDLDLQSVEREIDRQEALSSGMSVDVALARFSIALTKGAREAAAYIDKHRELLLRFLNPSFVASIEIQNLAQAGQIDLAEARVRDLSDPSVSLQERDRLIRVIAEAKGADRTEARERQFKATDSLIDLANLIETLEEEKDRSRLANYGRTYFDRTHDLPALRVYAQALFETGRLREAAALLHGEKDLTARSSDLKSLLAWSLYKLGDVLGGGKVLTELRATRDVASDRALTVNLAIASGDWASLVTFVEEEWIRRNERDAEDLLRAGQLANQLGSARAKDLISEAAAKGDESPAILIGCYSSAVSAGWENEETSKWLERGAALSGEDGPVKQVSLKQLMELNPAWEERENETWAQLISGNLPMFAAGSLLNRSLVDLYLLPALSNMEQVDPRRRQLIYAFSGTRTLTRGNLRTAAFDPTALLTAGFLGTLDTFFARFEKIVIPHGTLAWLFDEKQQIQFHQPSRISDAKEIKQLIDADVLQTCDSTAAGSSELATEVGDELASLFLLAESDFGEDRRQRLVVRSSPIHRVRSLMEEEADLGVHSVRVCGCLDLVNALARLGQLTQGEAQRARAYLSLREKPWRNAHIIEPGAVLYLDQLSIIYLQHLRLLPKIRAAGLTGIIPSAVETRAHSFVTYENLAARAIDIIDLIRRTLHSGIKSERVIIAPESTDSTDVPTRLRSHPTFRILDAAALADGLIIDDRHFNRFGSIQMQSETKPIWTTFDLVAAGDPAQQREYLATMRRANLGFIPISAEELRELVEHAVSTEGLLRETAELKALRENLLCARMSNGLQLPNEHVWLDDFVRSFIYVIKSQWYEGMDEEIAEARCKWLLSQIDVRGWAHRFRIDGHPEIAALQFRAQLISMALLEPHIPNESRLKYWRWFDTAMLEQVKNEQRELYGSIIQFARGIIEDAYASSDGGNSDDH